MYRKLGQDAGYVRQAGFDRVQQAQMVLSLVAQKGAISRRDVVELCQLSPDQATRLLRALAAEGKLVRHGDRKGATYARA